MLAGILALSEISRHTEPDARQPARQSMIGAAHTYILPILTAACHTACTLHMVDPLGPSESFPSDEAN